jgi:spore germination protein GerM
MPRSRASDKIPFGWIIGLGLTLFTAGGATAWWATHHLASSQKKTVTPLESPISSEIVEQPTPIASPSPVVKNPTPTPEAVPVTETRQIYWLKVTDTGSQLVPQEITIQKSQSRTQELTELFQSLLAGPNNPNDTTTIPAGTKLLSLKEDKTGIRINLSPEFATDDGSDALIGRLAQILYTATSINPDAPVWIQVAGKPLELLGEGHGLEIAQPMTRKFFEDNYQL